MAMRHSPCKNCLQKDKCPNMCDVWKIWFHDSWEEIQTAASRKYGFKPPEEKSGGDGT